MSTGEKVPLHEAKKIAEDLMILLDSGGFRVNAGICGSIRRQKSFVGDIEIVAESTPKLLALMDKLLLDGVYTKADYNGKPRWGDKYRGVMFQGMKCEVFLADYHNLGYITWLRTGPGDANQYIMNVMKAQKSPVRFIDGHAWICDYHNDEPTPVQMLSIPNEYALFGLLRMPYIDPWERSLETYARHRVNVQDLEKLMQLAAPKEPSKPKNKGLPGF